MASLYLGNPAAKIKQPDGSIVTKPIIYREYGDNKYEWLRTEQAEFKDYWCVHKKDLSDMLSGHKRYQP